MRILSAADLAALADPAALIPTVEDAMRRVSERAVELPLRTVMPLGGGNALGIMPGALADPPCYGAKLLSLFPGNPAHGRSSHAGMMVLFNAETGLPRACMDASHLTAMRTAAASAVATRALAREDASVLAIIGTGEQAHAHLTAIQAVRELRRILVWGRDPAKAAAFAAAHPGIAVAPTIEEAFAAADIVCTVTAARRPIVTPEMLHPGLHLNAVGASVPTMQEIAPECLAGAAVFTDFRPSAEAQAGELREARQRGLLQATEGPAEIGDVLRGHAQGRPDDEAITIYRSLGIAAQDLAAACYVLARAEHEGRGIEAEI
jgi:alanine dehydrogenase